MPGLSLRSTNRSDPARLRHRSASAAPSEAATPRTTSFSTPWATPVAAAATPYSARVSPAPAPATRRNTSSRTSPAGSTTGGGQRHVAGPWAGSTGITSTRRAPLRRATKRACRGGSWALPHSITTCHAPAALAASTRPLEAEDRLFTASPPSPPPGSSSRSMRSHDSSARSRTKTWAAGWSASHAGGASIAPAAALGPAGAARGAISRVGGRSQRVRCRGSAAGKE
mmetsp:Transcript_4598/g.15436  ORF Transcript_4598/g.15436 Transcript_4598/m.15436 type:complete len:227 (-) Transcript_4598:240-920(-)